ncbi:MAG: phosphoribosylformylglycinamidine synthase subunit PurQ, partial [Atopobiaceae bacterium]|nr:phosphoribosylformylglycinamidine synthase subunit PurQ [Atopobiaceae bacterium]
AGGVSVAIGELADGLAIDLDRVPKKYEGLDGTELAISESQERMAVALAPEDVDTFIGYAHDENLEATVVASVTQQKRLTMTWDGATIVDVSREFLSSNGAPKHQRVHVEAAKPYSRTWEGDTLESRMTSLVSDLNVCSNKGLSERFDSTIGAATVLMPFGGARQLTPALGMAAKLPVDGETTTCSGMAWGFNPYLMEADQFAGAYLSVVESMAKLVATGFEHENAYLSFQEYFERLRDEAERWGKPCAAVLGALMAQVDLGVGAIGGKDSMSGSFEQLDVPPTLVSFATAVGTVDHVTSPEWKQAGSRLVALVPRYAHGGLMPEAAGVLEAFSMVEGLIADGSARAVTTPGYGGMAEALFKSCLGNRIGIELAADFPADALFDPAYATMVVELADGATLPEATERVAVVQIGHTTESYQLVAAGETIDLAKLEGAWARPLEEVFPYRAAGETVTTLNHQQSGSHERHSATHVARPHVIIPVFPGTNCEYDSARAFERAGADVSTLVIKNLTPQSVAESCEALVSEIRRSQIVMLPGGFSGGDEPDGSAKFITAFFRAPAVTEAVRDLLQARDGLMLGICNGFQALVKLGLVPYGDIRPMDDACPTLTFNTIGRHQSRLVRTRVASDLSPWLSKCEVGDIHTVAISHGEGRFVASPDLLARLEGAGQVATQYVDADGVPSLDLDVCPNGSVDAIEGITSPDGRVLGKMGHTERSGHGLYENVPGDCFQPLIEGGVAYFTD